MAVIVCTGPSLSPQQLNQVNNADVVKFGVNNTWSQLALHHLITVNPSWWEYYWYRDGLLRDEVYDGEMEAWCLTHKAATKYPINLYNWFDDEACGLSDNPDYVNIGHSSGFAALNIAYLMGCSPILLVGHDMKFPSGYDAQKKNPGGARHYFGEYPEDLQHWPSIQVGKDGTLDGLLVNYKVAAQQNKVEIINCTPGSALDYFPRRELNDLL